MAFLSTPIIQFEQVSFKHKDTLFQWLAEPHMQAFWDNSQEHKDDILIFINGRKEPSPYFNGIFTYWVGLTENEPYCFLLTSQVTHADDCPTLWQQHLSTTGKTYTIDFGIGNTAFLGKGLAAETLQAFTEFYQQMIDPEADTFFIDPDDNNPKAKHVYEKAGFKTVGMFKQLGRHWDFSGDQTYLMVKYLPRLK